jgi:hypothetical protein
MSFAETPMNERTLHGAVLVGSLVTTELVPVLYQLLVDAAVGPDEVRVQAVCRTRGFNQERVEVLAAKGESHTQRVCQLNFGFSSFCSAVRERMRRSRC